MLKYQQQVAQIISKNKYIAASQSSVGGGGGGGGGGGSNSGRVMMRLVDRKDRPHAEVIVQQLRRELAGIPGVNSFVSLPPSIRIGGMQSKSLYQFTLQDTDLKNLYSWTPRVEARMAQIPGLQDVTSDLRISSPQITVDIDRDKARAMGVQASDIENTLYNAYGQRQVTTIFTASNQYYVILEVLPQYPARPDCAFEAVRAQQPAAASGRHAYAGSSRRRRAFEAGRFARVRGSLRSVAGRDSVLQHGAWCFSRPSR